MGKDSATAILCFAREMTIWLGYGMTIQNRILIDHLGPLEQLLCRAS